MLFFSYLCKVIKTYNMVIDVHTAFTLLGIISAFVFLVVVLSDKNKK